jgi:SAM-dependent methyltransferase
MAVVASYHSQDVVARGARAREPGVVVSTETQRVIRLQGDEHPLIDEGPPATPREHVNHLVHLMAYQEAKRYAGGLDVLDIGCNTGYGTIGFVGVARRVVGVDVSERAVAAASARPGAEGARFLLVDGIDLPFPTASFDLVTCFQVIEHVPEPVPLLRAITGVLRPGGTVIFTTPNATIRLDRGMVPWNRFHVREYEPAELRDMLRESFPEVRIRGLFATPTLYETEIRAVTEARERARLIARGDKAAANAAPARSQSSARRLARAVIPRRLRSRLLALAAGHDARERRPTRGSQGAQPPAPMDLQAFTEFTVDDLFYSDRDLDRALDLIAMCRVPSGTEADEGISARAAASDEVR